MIPLHYMRLALHEVASRGVPLGSMVDGEAAGTLHSQWGQLGRRAASMMMGAWESTMHGCCGDVLARLGCGGDWFGWWGGPQLAQISHPFFLSMPGLSLGDCFCVASDVRLGVPGRPASGKVLILRSWASYSTEPPLGPFC